MPKKSFIIIGSGFVALCLVIFCFVLVDITKYNSTHIANFADNVLRPVLGNTATITLESWFYNLTDVAKQIQQNHSSSTLPQPGQSSGDSVHWKTILTSPVASTSAVIQVGEYYPDKIRNYAFVHLVKIDTKQVDIGAVAGKKEPASEVGNPGPGKIPSDIVTSNRLIAAFNGGFQYRDGQYGMIVGGKTYLPLQEGLATLLADTQSHIAISEYHGGVDVSKYPVIRQNGEMLIRDGAVIPSSQDKLAKVWGRSVTSNMYTWRSGLGVTADGSLIYAVGPSLIPQTLGIALQAAGAVNAMQIDMNPYWVRFVVFKPLGNGKYTHQSLFNNMFDGGNDFLNGYQKDFFYISLKPEFTQSQSLPTWKITTRQIHKKKSV